MSSIIAEEAVVGRRRLLQAAAGLGGASLLGLGGCVTSSGQVASSGSGAPYHDPVPPLAPVRAHADRVFDITVCTRPFRAQGPRLDTESIGDALIVHNYGHGGSGWSLSWGSSTIAVQKAMAASPREVAVVGCGALGLTSAILAQRAGAKVTIYARDLYPQVRSARATGSWTPDSRVALTGAAGPAFGPLWEQMARTSWKTYRDYLGLPGDPVVFTDRYRLAGSRPREPAQPGALDFAEYSDRYAQDTGSTAELLPSGSTPFDWPEVYRSTELMFNLRSYGHLLMGDFLTAGGHFVRTEFHEPGELARLSQKVVINCPGYAAREWWKDQSVVPVRGQIGWLIPQAEVNYGVQYAGVSVLSRTDGILIQELTGGDMKGYGDATETVDRAETLNALAKVEQLFETRFKARRG
jgi:glycine/D-amino acid oxidase-like deaminating enzyme